MKNGFNILLVFIMIIFGGCASASKEKSFTQESVKTYSENLFFSGKASWYGGSFNGKLTASGVRYDSNELVAAHKTLPFGTIVRVTSVKSGKSVVVKIIDRGPFVRTRILDLSEKAFSQIAMIKEGVIEVKVEVLGN